VSLLVSTVVFALTATTPAPGVDGSVHALASDAGGVYVGGAFTAASGIPAANVVRWTGSAWQPLGAGTNGPVYALYADGAGVYAGGDFDTAGGVPASNLAYWNGASWEAVGGGVSGDGAVVKAIAPSPAGLLVAGIFAAVGAATPANGLGRWNGSTWDVLGGVPPGILHDLRAVLFHNDTIFVGGVLHFPGDPRRAEGTLARATPFVLSDYAGSVNAADECIGCSSVDALIASGADFIAAGAFTRLGSIVLTGSPYDIVRLANATVPVGLGEGAVVPSVAGGGAIRALAVNGSGIVAGGNFHWVRGVGAGHVARFESGAWAALGAGVSGPVRALVVWNGEVFAGGDFATAGGQPANRVARWDRAAWHPLAGEAVPVRATTWGGLKARFR
jgi:hypothetical protein